MSQHRPRRQCQSHLEFREQDYCLLEAAATEALRRTGSFGKFDKAELVSVGWELVFFYAKSYDWFEKYGYVHAVKHMQRHIYNSRSRCVSLEELEEQGFQWERLEEVGEPLPLEFVKPLVLYLHGRNRWIVEMRLHGVEFHVLAEMMSVSCSSAQSYYWQAVRVMRERLQLSNPEFFAHY